MYIRIETNTKKQRIVGKPTNLNQAASRNIMKSIHSKKEVILMNPASTSITNKNNILIWDLLVMRIFGLKNRKIRSEIKIMNRFQSHIINLSNV